MAKQKEQRGRTEIHIPRSASKAWPFLPCMHWPQEKQNELEFAIHSHWVTIAFNQRLFLFVCFFNRGGGPVEEKKAILIDKQSLWVPADV